MKILFLCGSLAPGRDGVGDYTRRLAGELIRQGHNAAIIALNDKHIEVLENASQVTDYTEVQVLRLPAAMASKERYAKAKLYIDEFVPQWLSLQYVPFSFQNKGLPWRLGRELSRIGKGRKWQIMFHELWVGMNVESSLKLKLWGDVQRLILRNILWQLKPKTVHTQTKVYQFQISKLGYYAHYLPLFGNIPVGQTKNKKSCKANNALSFVIFGTIHPGAPVNEFAKQVKEYSITNNTAVELIFIGRCGAEQSTWIAAWSEQGLPYKVMGEQTPEKISDILHNSDCGITTTPLLQVEKSGTVAAMLDHFLPIICVCRKWTIHAFPISNLKSKIVCFDEYFNFVDLIENKSISEKLSLDLVSKQFIDTLNAIKH